MLNLPKLVVDHIISFSLLLSSDDLSLLLLLLTKPYKNRYKVPWNLLELLDSECKAGIIDIPITHSLKSLPSIHDYKYHTNTETNITITYSSYSSYNDNNDMIDKLLEPLPEFYLNYVNHPYGPPDYSYNYDDDDYRNNISYRDFMNNIYNQNKFDKWINCCYRPITINGEGVCQTYPAINKKGTCLVVHIRKDKDKDKNDINVEKFVFIVEKYHMEEFRIDPIYSDSSGKWYCLSLIDENSRYKDCLFEENCKNLFDANHIYTCRLDIYMTTDIPIMVAIEINVYWRQILEMHVKVDGELTLV